MGEACLDPALIAAARVALAVLLFSAAAHKVRNFDGFRAALGDYELLAHRWLTPVAALIVGLESATGLGLILPASGALPALAAAGLLAAYTGAITVNLARGRRHIDCGCVGSMGHQPLSGGLVVRNLLLMALALVAALPAGGRSLVWLDAVTVVAGVTALALLYGAAGGALTNAARLTASSLLGAAHRFPEAGRP